ncbi:unnamed protein product [Gadus morhua 'NCC']
MVKFMRKHVSLQSEETLSEESDASVDQTGLHRDDAAKTLERPTTRDQRIAQALETSGVGADDTSKRQLCPTSVHQGTVSNVTTLKAPCLGVLSPTLAQRIADRRFSSVTARCGKASPLWCAVTQSNRSTCGLSEVDTRGSHSSVVRVSRGFAPGRADRPVASACGLFSDTCRGVVDRSEPLGTN